MAATGSLGGNSLAGQPSQGNLYAGQPMLQTDEVPLTPAEQANADQANHPAGRVSKANGSLGGTAVGETAAPGYAQINIGPAYDAQVRDTMYAQQKAQLDPQWQQTQHDQETKLANMGLSRGSEAWNREYDSLNRAKTNAYDQAQRGSILAGGAEASRQVAEQMDAQRSAQAWDAINAQRSAALASAKASMHAANVGAQASMYGANKSSESSRYATDSASQLGNRGYDLNERGQDFDQALRLERDPYEIQNLQMSGMYPTQDPTFPGYGGGTGANQNQADYAAQINAGNTRSYAGINQVVGALGGYFLPPGGTRTPADAPTGG